MKRLLGRTVPEDAVSQLDMLTKEENVMGVAKSLESTQCFLLTFGHLLIPIRFSRVVCQTVLHEIKRLLLPDNLIVDRQG